MRAARRLLAAAAARSEQYLTPNTPTGLTGLRTHPNPRQRLIYVYNQTLEKLSKFPEYSAYRQSTEAITKKRLEIIQAAVPQGYEDWQVRVRKQIEDNPQIFGPGGNAKYETIDGKRYLVTRYKETADEREVEYDGEPISRRTEGPAEEDERETQDVDFGRELDPVQFFNADIQLETEPPLTVQQINDIEQKIGAGLIEEIVQVAEGEAQLVDVMFENRVWEDLEEKPAEGQWEYFERPTHSGTTQGPA